ncbi:MAG TPA: hypothetical protein PK720_00465 [bacterium]|nr:hypothetical protein [bacterium]
MFKILIINNSLKKLCRKEFLVKNEENKRDDEEQKKFLQSLEDQDKKKEEQKRERKFFNNCYNAAGIGTILTIICIVSMGVYRINLVLPSLILGSLTLIILFLTMCTDPEVEFSS